MSEKIVRKPPPGPQIRRQRRVYCTRHRGVEIGTLEFTWPGSFARDFALDADQFLVDLLDQIAVLPLVCSRCLPPARRPGDPPFAP